MKTITLPSEFGKKLEARQRKTDRAWRKLVKAFETLHRECPGKAKPLYRKMEAYLEAADDVNEFLLLDAIERRHEIIPQARAGLHVLRVQAERRAEWSRLRCAEWDKWQTWIDDKRRDKGWSFAFAQRRAAEHFWNGRQKKESMLKSIKRHTKKTGTS